MYVALTISQEQLYIIGGYPVENHSLIYYIQELKSLNYDVKPLEYSE